MLLSVLVRLGCADLMHPVFNFKSTAMHRRHFIQTSLFAGTSLLFQKQLVAQLARTDEGSLRMLRNNVGIYTERGGTIGFLLSKDGILVIDAQFPDTAPHFIKAVKKQNTAPFRYLLNTHHHGDHTSGNIAFKGIVEQVFAHQNSASNQKTVAEKQAKLDQQLLPGKTFEKAETIRLGNEKITCSYFGAGHTDGDALYHFEEANIVHLGDLMFNKRHPFVDRSAGASMRNWITVLDNALKKYNKDTLYIFGHSLNPGEETGTHEDLKKFQTYLGQVLQFAEAEIKSGVSKEAFIKNTEIPGNTEWKGDGIERPLTAAYEELTTA